MRTVALYSAALERLFESTGGGHCDFWESFDTEVMIKLGGPSTEMGIFAEEVDARLEVCRSLKPPQCGK
eukprot:6220628-Prymnesium_polylepis.1